MPELALRTLRSERAAMIGWSLSTLALVAVVLAFWPSIEGDDTLTRSFGELPPSVQSAVGIADLGTPAGYLQGQLFSTLGPLIFLSFAIGRGARAIAGEEERGTMDLLLATPIHRARVVIEKAVALLAGLLALGLVTWLGLVAIGPLVDIDLSAGKLAAATAGNLLLGVLYGGIALCLSGATGRRGLSLGIAAGLAAAGFLYTSIAPFVAGLSDHLGFSPFQWAYGDEPLRNGADWGDFGLLLAGGLLFTALAVALFDRRDVR
ncbi:ABC transporter permease [Conexibacter arvalis]|uniref:ABC-2 type transport system permease protein n=1 Tax=Conexibacter arvalis TaxID=912552 RepID=A0A840IB64_9ACTN|nr:ABC transporter permease subunit [Conexibacter arvalis]MBB4661483.1 ABC-2 type transport system permease protein [Conexibacter arvalis]